MLLFNQNFGFKTLKIFSIILFNQKWDPELGD